MLNDINQDVEHSLRHILSKNIRLLIFRGKFVDRFKEFLAIKPTPKSCSQLNLGIIKEFREYQLAAESRPKTKSMNFELKALRTIFDYGKKWKLIENNPTDGIRFQRVTDAKPLRILDKYEINHLLASCDDDIRYVILGFYTPE